MQAQDEEAMAQIRRGIPAFRATGAAVLVPYLCTVGRTRLVLGFACGDPGCHLVVVVGDVILSDIVGSRLPHAIVTEDVPQRLVEILGGIGPPDIWGFKRQA